MTPKARRLYFFSACLAFIILAPLFVLYASGFRVDFRDFDIYRTGVLVVSSKPKNAQVHLNNRPLTSTTPIRFSTLTPAQYDISLSKESFLTWSSRIRISPSRSTVLSDIPLFFADPKKSPLWSGDFNQVIASPSHELLAIVTGSSEDTSLHILTVDGKSRQTIANLPAGNVLATRWSAQETKLLLTIQNADTERHFLVHLSSSSSLDMTPLFQAVPANLWWGDQDDDFLYYSSAQGLHRLDLFTRTTQIISKLTVSDFLPYGNGGYFLSNGSSGIQLWWHDPTRTENTLLRTFDDGQQYKLQGGPDQWLALVNTGQKRATLIRHIPGNPLLILPLDIPVTELSWNKHNPKYVLAGDSVELNLINTETGRVALLSRTSQPYQEFHWLPQINLAIIAYQDGIETHTIDPEYPSQTKILALDPASQHFVGVDASETALIIAETNDGIKSVQKYIVR